MVPLVNCIDVSRWFQFIIESRCMSVIFCSCRLVTFDATKRVVRQNWPSKNVPKCCRENPGVCLPMLLHLHLLIKICTE